jgi:hypothetical protein
MASNPFEEITARLNRIDELLVRLDATMKGLTVSDNRDIGNIETAVDATLLSRSTIYKHVAANRIPFIKKNGRIYFSRLALRNWLFDNQIKKI